MNKQLIYIVEDDDGIREVYEGALGDDYDVRLFYNGAQFFTAFKQTTPDIIILDLMLPDMDGYEILQNIRSVDQQVPIIIVSAKSDEISYVKGLNKGADDYIKKPFSVLELLACVKANLRRANLHVSSSGGFFVDSNLYKVFYNDKDLGLTLKEFMLLKSLIANAGVTVTREALFKEAWKEDFMGETRTLDMHIASLRDKIKKAGGADCIVTVRDVGYRYENK